MSGLREADGAQAQRKRNMHEDSGKGETQDSVCSSSSRVPVNINEEPNLARFVEQRAATTRTAGRSPEIQLKTIEAEGRGSVGEREAERMKFVVGLLREQEQWSERKEDEGDEEEEEEEEALCPRTGCSKTQ
ncbi:unnamed protein product [Pleuronectes platessa]|uniref:Uncharacterized protein n=1 Tax=Pleuronectes platessa TaxID=8262 RepID=A0A9N7TQ57_PLEPL|nr:unnamed protein product [Pleuronectes platessa]